MDEDRYDSSSSDEQQGEGDDEDERPSKRFHHRSEPGRGSRRIEPARRDAAGPASPGSKSHRHRACGFLPSWSSPWRERRAIGQLPDLLGRAGVGLAAHGLPHSTASASSTSSSWVLPAALCASCWSARRLVEMRARSEWGWCNGSAAAPAASLQPPNHARSPAKSGTAPGFDSWRLHHNHLVLK